MVRVSYNHSVGIREYVNVQQKKKEINFIGKHYMCTPSDRRKYCELRNEIQQSTTEREKNRIHVGFMVSETNFPAALSERSAK